MPGGYAVTAEASSQSRKGLVAEFKKAAERPGLDDQQAHVLKVLGLSLENLHYIADQAALVAVGETAELVRKLKSIL